jgi:NADH:ubiquinone oxidoreductase subunit 2 (subunit N)
MEMPVDLAFLPALPEIVLAVGVLILLMVGAFGGNRAVPIVTALAIALIVFAALGRLFMPTAGVAFDERSALVTAIKFLRGRVGFYERPRSVASCMKRACCAESSLKMPVNCVVMVATSGFLTPRIDMH